MKRKKINAHLTLEARLFIEESLNEGKTVTKIANDLNRNKSNISREILKHRVSVFPSSFNKYNACLKNSNCPYKTFECYKHCKNIDFNLCEKLKSSPHTCNSCTSKNHCRCVKYYYKALEANMEYQKHLFSCRKNLHYSELELCILNNDFKNLVFQNKSVYHSLLVINKRGFDFKRSSIYRQIKAGRLELKYEDLPRFRKEKISKNNDKTYKSSHVKGHTYEDYLDFKEKNKEASEVQMDTVEGIKGTNEPVMLTLQIVEIKFLFIYRIEHQTIDEVISKINLLREKLTEKKFNLLFNIWLTDNGKEFNNVDKITSSFPNTNIFYCHPYSSYEKGSIENNHRLIREVVPKNISLKPYTQNDYDLLTSHINSLYREELEGKCPFDLVSKYLSNEDLERLNLKQISAEKINLNPSLLGAKNIENIKRYLSKEDIKKRNLRL